MKRLATGILAGGLALATAPAAHAASVGQFLARGTFESMADGQAQDVALTIAFKTGHIRIESNSKDSGKSIILATRGKDDVAMLDPVQKIVVHMKPSMLKAASGVDSADIGSYQSLLDPVGFKGYIVKHGKKLGAGPSILGHATTLYQAERKGDGMKVWLADDVSLPLQIEGHSASGGHFSIHITSLDLHPSFGAHEFDELPPGYQDIRAELNPPGDR